MDRSPMHNCSRLVFKNAPIENVALAFCEFSGAEKGNVVQSVNCVSPKTVYANGKLVESVS
jgi:hypothetical protein